MFFLFLRFYYFIFRGRGREREKDGEKHQLVASCTSPTGDMAHNPGTCPDGELNWPPFHSQADAQSTEPHQRRLNVLSKITTRIMNCWKGKLVIIIPMILSNNNYLWSYIHKMCRQARNPCSMVSSTSVGYL